MTLKINHSFVSAKPVGTDSTRIYSDSWNANHTITGQADGSQLNPNVVQAVVSDTNVTGSIASQTLTLSWSGTLAATRLNANVVQAITNDTNITGSISAQNLTLAWSGTLAANRGGFGADISAQSGVPLFATGVATFTGTTGTANFVRATSPTITTPTLSGLTTQAIGSDTAQFTLVTGSGGNGRLLESLESGNVKLRSQNSVTLALGVNLSDVFTISATSATLSQPLIYGGVTANNAVTGTGNLVLSTSPTFVTPALGTPASGVLTNCTGLPLGGLTTQAAYTIVGNFTGSSAVPTASTIGALTQKASPAGTDLVIIQDQAASGQIKYASVSSIAVAGAVASIDTKTGAFTTGNGLDSTAGNIIELTAARRTLPTRQTFTSGSGTYTTPANCLWIEVEMCGGGGGSGGSGSSATAGGAGNPTTFGTSFLTANGGNGAGTTNGSPSTGGSATGGDINISGANGQAPAGGSVLQPGGLGGSTPLGIHGTPVVGTNAGNAGSGYGSGGSGAGGSTTGPTNTGGGGAAAGYLRKIINTPSATYAYAVGSGGSAGTAGTGGNAGALGAGGIIIVIEHYGS